MNKMNKYTQGSPWHSRGQRFVLAGFLHDIGILTFGFFGDLFIIFSVYYNIDRKESVMDDRQLIDLFFARSESAISESEKKYGSYLRHIAYNILNDRLDSEECVNDTFLNAWRSIPPHRPNKLSAFLGRITRNLALDRYRSTRSAKRGGGAVSLSLEELGSCFGTADDCDSLVDSIVLGEIINGFLAGLSRSDRVIFVQRYWYFCSIDEIAENLCIGQSRVKMSLLRSRSKLRQLLEKEGVAV